ncbi:MAG: hypothetical protein ACI4PG_01270 [Candidatus Ventricola sp.]
MGDGLPPIDSRRAEHMDSLRQALTSARRATRAQLARATGLSAMTVGKLLGEMELRGEVSQDGFSRALSGRPSIVASYCGDYAHFATVSVEQQEGQSAFVMSVFNLFGERVYSEQMRLGEVREDSFDPFFARARDAGLRLRLAVFALPGEAEGDCLFISDFEALLYGRFLPRIRERFGVETLFENDVNMAVLGHAMAEGAQKVCAGAYFPRRYCPGAGAVIDGRILHGQRHFAGEIAFLQEGAPWAQLDYGDAQRAAEAIEPLVAAYACILAPQTMVLYGDFLTPELMEQIRVRLRKRLQGQFEMKLDARSRMTPDMERGARRMGLDRMRALLGEEDNRRGETDP